jgi:hypothetical protein
MSHGVVAVEGVVVAAPDAAGLDLAGVDEVGEDALGRAFGDADAFGYVAQTDIGCLGKAEEYLGMVGEEGPGGRSICASNQRRRAARVPDSRPTEIG